MKISKWVGIIQDDLKNNHKDLLTESWINSGLLLHIDGSQDAQFKNTMQFNIINKNTTLLEYPFETPKTP